MQSRMRCLPGRSCTLEERLCGDLEDQDNWQQELEDEDEWSEEDYYMYEYDTDFSVFYESIDSDNEADNEEKAEDENSFDYGFGIFFERL